MSNCPECNKTMGLHDLFIAGLCPNCAGKHITHQAKRIAELDKWPPSKEILVCICGWYGRVEDQDALGSECGCCPDCGNEELLWLNELQELIKELEAEKELLKKEAAEWEQTVESQHWEKEQYKKALEKNGIDVKQALKVNK